MRLLSQATALILASACSALVMLYPTCSSADPYWAGTPRWNAPSAYAQPWERCADRRSEEWQRWQHDQAELNQAHAAMYRDRDRLAHERREMREAWRDGDWRAFQHERREAEQAEHALQHDYAQAAHERQELWQQHRRFSHPHRDWDDE